MLAIYTRSTSMLSKEFWKWVVRRVIGKYSGPNAVEDSLLRGLRELHVPYKRNAGLGKTDTAIVLSGTKALQEAILAKESGLIEILVAGPNIVANPIEEPFLLSNQVDHALVPSQWVKDLWINLSPKIATKIAVWPSGVEIRESSTRSGSPIIYDKSGDGDFLEKIKAQVDNCRVFTYGEFKRKDYLEALKTAPYLIYLSHSESQGLALQEAWAHDVPTLVNKSASWQSGELSWEAPQINCPYLIPDLGEVFDNPTDIPIIVERITSLHPKIYCDKELSDQASATKLLDIIKNTHVQNS